MQKDLLSIRFPKGIGKILKMKALAKDMHLYEYIMYLAKIKPVEDNFEKEYNLDK